MRYRQSELRDDPLSVGPEIHCRVVHGTGRGWMGCAFRGEGFEKVDVEWAMGGNSRAGCFGGWGRTVGTWVGEV